MATVKKSLKAVDSSKKPGLAKLPTEVRNKMGYAQDGMPIKRGGLQKYSSKSVLDSINKRPVVRSLEVVKGKKPMKAGGMLKRADGSYSKRGLWDNIRANKGSGKKPTAAMLKQEKKIKAKSK
jgi:hypothetical protein